MKNLFRAVLALTVALFANAVTSNAQTLAFNGIGSSALFLELGEGATVAPTSATCLWSYGSNAVKATDTTVTPNAVDNGQVWIEWTTGTGGTCAAPTSSSQVYSYLQTDSVVGDRCLFNGCVISAGSAGNPTTLTSTALITGTTGTQVSTVPTVIWNAINGVAVNASGTDIRPEDAKFATTRALTACGTPINQYTGTGTAAGAATQYLGLGYTNGSQIIGFTGSTFNVVNFTLPSTFYVTPVGADPIVVAVSYTTSGSGTGFNSTSIKNLNRSTLALYLDGSISQTSAALSPGTTETSTASTVFVREPLSGTYNTMEFNIPNSVELQTSQDVGVNQIPFSASHAFNQNCDGTVPYANATGVHLPTLGSGTRTRAIGTGQELSSLFAANDALGYAFWGISNFAAAPAATSKYLTVDGIDPLRVTYSTGVIPTGTGVTSTTVNFAHVIDGTYPIWSLLRLVSKTTAVQTVAGNLSTAAQSFSGSTHPDFVPYANLAVERAHFTPPGIYSAPACSSATAPPAPVNHGSTGTATEVGGDVGGMVITYTADEDYTTDYTAATITTGGFTGTTTTGLSGCTSTVFGEPTSSRRQ